MDKSYTASGSRTRKRVFGEETPWSAWTRNHPLLDSRDFSIYISDIDACVFRFGDATLFPVEVKTRSGRVNRFQQELLHLLDQALRRVDGEQFDTLRGKRPIRFPGVFTLRLSGTSPDNSDEMWFGRVGYEPCAISQDELVRVLGGAGQAIDPSHWFETQRRLRGEKP
ncbi:MAG: hypothetical protein IH851_01205 [Armatimonadetes bacterium]|nr:hypothetical protein [Armatimonadota bacterium]